MTLYKIHIGQGCKGKLTECILYDQKITTDLIPPFYDGCTCYVSEVKDQEQLGKGINQK